MDLCTDSRLRIFDGDSCGIRQPPSVNTRTVIGSAIIINSLLGTLPRVVNCYKRKCSGRISSEECYFITVETYNGTTV